VGSSPFSSTKPPAEVAPAPDRDRFPDQSWAQATETREHMRSIVRDLGARAGDRIQAAKAHLDACKTLVAMAGGLERGAGKAEQAAAQAAGAAYAAEVMAEAMGLAGPAPEPWATKPGDADPKRAG